jgi:hypothetical protein
MDQALDDVANFVHAWRRLVGTEGPPAYSLVVSFVVLSPTYFSQKGQTIMQMTDIQQAVATVEATTSEGNPAGPLDTPPAWSSSDETIVLVQPSADGMTCVISSPSPGPLGSAVVTVDATVGGAALTATLAVDIVASAAAALTISVAAPTP